MIRLAAIIFLSLLGSLPAWAAFHGSPSTPPTVATGNSTVSVPPDTSTTFLTLTGSNGPTGWTIDSCSGCTGYLSVDSSGNLTVTSSGLTTGQAQQGAALTWTPTVHASNGVGAGPTKAIALTVYNDGALAASSGPYVFQTPNFFTGSGAGQANQSGQTPVARPPWKVPAVDYPLGPNVSSLQDPATVSIPHCAYSTSPSNRLICQSDGGAGITVDSVDFSMHGCVELRITNSVTGPIVVTNNRWIYSAGGGGGCEADKFMVDIGVSASSFDFERNYLNGCGIADASLSRWTAECTAQWYYGPSPSVNNINMVTLTNVVGAKTLRYNAFINSPNRAYSEGGTAFGTSEFDFNYGEQTGSLSVPYDHGEENLYNQHSATTTPLTFAANNMRYSTFLQPAAGGGANGLDSTFEQNGNWSVLTGSIAGTVLTVSGSPSYAMAQGQWVYGLNVAPGTRICDGTICAQTQTPPAYDINTSQTVASGSMEHSNIYIASITRNNNVWAGNTVANGWSGVSVFSYMPHGTLNLLSNYSDCTGVNTIFWPPSGTNLPSEFVGKDFNIIDSANVTLSGNINMLTGNASDAYVNNLTTKFVSVCQ